jgi:hypothetical protein
MSIELLPPIIRKKYEVHEWKHACAVLERDFPSEWKDILQVLTAFRLKKSYVMTPGGGLSPISQVINREFSRRGWEEKGFDTKVIVDKQKYESPTHKIDCYKNGVALEIEWNNKDPFYDRDLNNFRLLFDLRAISVGVIITRCDELQAVFDKLGKQGIGQSSTHMSKLLPRIQGGGGGGCPILVFGISKKLFEKNE